MEDKNKTVELEQYVITKYVDALGQLGEMNPKIWVHFEEGFANSPQGIYAFHDGVKYHYLSTEKGRINADETTCDMEKIAYRILSTLTHYYAFNYERDNKMEGTPRRKLAFEKQLQMHRLYGEYFYEKKKVEIDEILEKHPYKNS